MKKILLVTTFLCAVLTLPAQNSYDFNVNNETYQDLTGSTSLNNDQVWDDPHYAIPLGFDFQIATHTFNTLHIVDWSVGGVLSSIQNDVGVIPLIMPIGQDIIDRGYFTGVSQSNLSYKIEGVTGNRIVKIEWNNVGFWDDTTDNDFMNFQLWLYEGTHIIEYRYGPSSINNPAESYEGETGPMVAFMPSVDIDTEEMEEEAYFLTGNPVNPTVLVIEPGNEPSNWNTLTGTIPDGTVYKFTPKNLSIQEFEKTGLVIFPNPAKDYLHINVNNDQYEVKIYNSLGQSVNNFIETNGTLDVSGLSSGIYIVQVKTTNGSATQKFVKL